MCRTGKVYAICLQCGGDITCMDFAPLEVCGPCYFVEADADEDDE